MKSALFAACLCALGCSSSSQTGPIGPCLGASLSGPTAFAPLSGLVYQHPIVLGTGMSAGGGPWIAVIWQGDGGGAAGSASFAATCAAVADAGFPSTFFVPPQTLTFALIDPLATGPEQSLLVVASAESQREDLLAAISVNAVSQSCVSGTFDASVAPSNPADGTPIDGGIATSLSGSFDLPLCRH